MGYTHYWYRPEKLDKNTFKKFVQDVSKIIETSELLGINIANGLGEDSPIITNTIINFNGSAKQKLGEWTTDEPIVIPWPSELASIQEPIPGDGATDGGWFAGTIVSKRIAPVNKDYDGASGDYETFEIEQFKKKEKWEAKGALTFAFCKTAYRPYDLTVTAVLVAFKHYFGDSVRIKSDGEEKDWIDGKIMCQRLFGYGFEHKLPQTSED